MNRSSNIAIIALTVAFLSFSLSLPARADGFFIPPHFVKELPKIPMQRAVISYHDGVETLIVESTFEGEGDTFGWIMPIPAEPTSYKLAPKMLLDTLTLATLPGYHHLGTTAGCVLISILLALPFYIIVKWILASVFGRLPIRQAFPRKEFWICLIVIVTIFWLSIFTPGMATWSASPPNPVLRDDIVKERILLGQYELTLLKPENAKDLSDWLSQNGLATVPPNAEQAVTEYIEAKHCFLAAKINRKEVGLTTPRPLAVTFPTESATYPMRLTAAAATNLYLELYVFGEGTARCKHLEPEYSGRFFTKELHPSTYALTGYDISSVTKPGTARIFSCEELDREIGLPSIAKLMWQGCVLTKLCGEVAPAEMREDFQVSFAGRKSFVKQVYDESASIVVSELHSIAFLGVATFLLFLVASGWLSAERVRRPFWLQCLAVAVILGSILFGVHFYLGSTRVPPIRRADQSRYLDFYFKVQVDTRLDLSKEEASSFTGKYTSKEAIQEAFAKHPPVRFRPRHLDDDDHDYADYYEVLEDERGIILRNYKVNSYSDSVGWPVDTLLIPRQNPVSGNHAVDSGPQN